MIDYSLDLWNKIGSRKPGGQELTKKLFSYLEMENTKVLDIGSGEGETANFFYNQGFEVFALDSSSELINKAKQKNENIKYYNGVGEKLPFEDNFFSVVIMECTLSICSNQEKVLNEIYRVLKNDGVFLNSDIYILENRSGLEKKFTELGFEIQIFNDEKKYLNDFIKKVIWNGIDLYSVIDCQFENYKNEEISYYTGKFMKR